MAEEKRGLLRVFGGEIWTDLRKLASKGVAVWVMATLVSAFGASALWLKGTTDIEKGLLGGVALTLSALLLLIVLLRYLNYRQSKKVTAMPPPPPNTFPQDPAGRLREVYSFWGPTFELAYESFFEGLYEPREAGSDDKSVIVQLVYRKVARVCIEDKRALDVAFQALPDSVTSEAYEKLLTHVNRVINVQYVELVVHLLLAGKAALGEERLYSSEWYRTLYRRHHEAVGELRRISDRPYLSGLASWQKTLGDLLPPPKPKPSADPASSTAFEPDQQP